MGILDMSSTPPPLRSLRLRPPSGQISPRRCGSGRGPILSEADGRSAVRRLYVHSENGSGETLIGGGGTPQSCSLLPAPNAGSRRSSAPSCSPARSRRRSSRCVHGRVSLRDRPRRTRWPCIPPGRMRRTHTRRRLTDRRPCTRPPRLTRRWSRPIPARGTTRGTTPTIRIPVMARARTATAARCRRPRSTRRTWCSLSARRSPRTPSCMGPPLVISSLPRSSAARRRSIRSTGLRFFSRHAFTSGRRPIGRNRHRALSGPVRAGVIVSPCFPHRRASRALLWACGVLDVCRP